MIFLFLVMVLVSALFSGLETGLYTTSRLRLFLDAQAGIPAARRAQRLLARMPSLLAVLLVCNNLANWGASFSAQAALIAAGVKHSEWIGTLAVSVVLFVAAESFPKSAYRRAQERWLYPTLPVLVGAHALLARPVAPITWFAGRLARIVARRAGAAAPLIRDAGLRSGEAEGFLTGFQMRVAAGVLAMRNRVAADEARPPQAYARARLGAPGVQFPEGCRDHRVLVLEAGSPRIVGWTPLAALWSEHGFRAPERPDLRPVASVEATTGLDRVYVRLDHSRAPFAVLPDGRVLDADLLRQAVIGADGEEQPDVTG